MCQQLCQPISLSKCKTFHDFGEYLTNLYTKDFRVLMLCTLTVAMLGNVMAFVASSSFTCSSANKHTHTHTHLQFCRPRTDTASNSVELQLDLPERMCYIPAALRTLEVIIVILVNSHHPTRSDRIRPDPTGS